METGRSREAARSGDQRRTGDGGFTLLELLTSMAILGLMVVMLFSVFEQINKAWLNGENRVETFTDARAILDLMSRELSQAITTTNTPHEITFYGDTNRVYFVAPVNANPNNLADLCEVGYEHQVVDPLSTPPGQLSLRIRRRLTEPTPGALGNVTTGVWDFYADPTKWWDDLSNPGKSFDPTREAILAANSILSLRFQYLQRNGVPYPSVPAYQSQLNNNTLPYAVVIFIDSVDSRTFARLKVVGGPNTVAGQSIIKPALRSFTTTVYMPNTTP